MRGEYTRVLFLAVSVLGSPPLARGIHGMRCLKNWDKGITPACAGNTSRIACEQLTLTDHPRLRGEYMYEREKNYLLAGSPPLARGILLL